MAKNESKMKLTSKQKQLVKEYISRLKIKSSLNEAEYYPPSADFDKSDNASVEQYVKKYSAYYNQFYNMVSKLTKASGYWYTTSASDPLIKKLQSMSADDLKKYRSKVASFLVLQREVNKKISELQIMANTLIKELE